MRDNKLTDNEIIKALECCPSNEYIVTYYDDEEIIVGDILRLIYRKNEDIRRLRYDNEVLNKQVCIAVDIAANAADEEIKEFAERVKRYIDVGHLRPPTEKCFSELDVVNMIDNLVKEMVGEDK